MCDYRKSDQAKGANWYVVESFYGKYKTLAYSIADVITIGESRKISMVNIYPMADWQKDYPDFSMAWPDHLQHMAQFTFQA